MSDFAQHLFDQCKSISDVATVHMDAGYESGRREALAENKALRAAVAEILPHLDQAARRFEGCYGEPYYAGVRNGVVALRAAMEGKDKP